jgi:hypothetical protein
LGADFASWQVPECRAWRISFFPVGTILYGKLPVTVCRVTTEPVFRNEMTGDRCVF